MSDPGRGGVSHGGGSSDSYEPNVPAHPQTPISVAPMGMTAATTLQIPWWAWFVAMGLLHYADRTRA